VVISIKHSMASHEDYRSPSKLCYWCHQQHCSIQHSMQCWSLESKSPARRLVTMDVELRSAVQRKV
jgi:hypothetical protein